MTNQTNLHRTTPASGHDAEGSRGQSSRNLILARIREALRFPAPPPHVIDRHLVDVPASSDPSSTASPGLPILAVLPADAGRPWLPDGGNSPVERLAILTENLDKLRAVVHRCADLSQAGEIVAGLARDGGWQRVAWHDDPLVAEVVRGLSCETYQVDAAQDADKNRLETCQAGITSCEGLVAQTGSILVDSRRSGGRGLSILPHVHIVVATVDQVAGTLGDAMQFIKDRHHGELPSMLSFITGPSRTGDIERILVLGAHGPKELHVVLIGDIESHTVS
ncbi:MAG: LutC/YkgG family protein [Pirellulales bacterium]